MTCVVTTNVEDFYNSPFNDMRDALVEEANSVVLLVEDDWLLRQSLVDQLGAKGWTVVEAESGETALEILKSDLSIGLLITDIRMGGGITGWDVAAAVRRQDPHFPVIYVYASPPRDPRRVPAKFVLKQAVRYYRTTRGMPDALRPVTA